jgi:hypothetical protein
MLRIPGSINSKNGTEEEFKIIQKWDGIRPNIKPLLFRFDLYLLVSKSKQFHKKTKQTNKNKRYHDPIIFSTDWSKKSGTKCNQISRTNSIISSANVVMKAISVKLVVTSELYTPITKDA